MQLPAPLNSKQQKQLIEQSIQSGMQSYIKQCHERVNDFVRTHYGFKGAFAINKKAIGLDMLKTPLNIIWTAPYFLLSNSGKLSQRLSNNKFGQRLSSLPAGFTTDVEKQVQWLIYDELLQLPYQQADRQSQHNALFDCILQQPQLITLFSDSFSQIAKLAEDTEAKLQFEQQLAQYVDSRKAAAELSSVLIAAASGYVANRGVSLGALSLGSTLAGSVSTHAAISSFTLGNTLGAFYYSVFPVSTAASTVILSTGAVAMLLGMVASYTGMITDPIQKSLGWHNKKLHRLIDNLGEQLQSEQAQSLAYKDAYVARIIDLADILLSIGNKLK